MIRTSFSRRLLTGTALVVASLLAAPMPASSHDTVQVNSGPVRPKTELGPFAPPVGMPMPTTSAAGEPALWSTLGTLTFPITTPIPAAQNYFDQGLRLSFAFNHAEARRAFQMAQKLDPTCALCYWGEALVLGPNINAPMDADAVMPAMAAITRAQELAGNATDKERAMIAALAKRYTADTGADRTALDQAYADAMAEVAARFPEDDSIAVLTAEAMMDAQPWDYWQPGGQAPKGRTADIVRLLEGTLARNPDHPGAIHLYIHAVEASDRPQRAEPHAERLAALMPGAGHLVHMPSHVYYRVGRYLDSMDANRAAVAADEAYLAQTEGSGIYRNGYYPHNIHFLMVSAQMAGDGPTAVTMATKLDQTLPVEAARAIPWVQPIKAAPYFAHAQFSDPGTILALPDPGDTLPYVRAMWHYARAIAHATMRDRQAAETEVQAIAAIKDQTDFSGLTAGGVPAPQVLEIAQRVAEGRIAQNQGDLPGAIRSFEAAVAIEDQLPYMEPPFWYYPVRQTLGGALMQAGDAARAEQAFRDSLKRVPNNGWALHGLMQAQQARGDTQGAAETARLLERAWVGDTQPLTMSKL